MNQEDLLQASLIEREYHELENNLQLIDAQIQELEKFREDLGFLIKSDNKEILSSLGRGVYLKSTIEDKNATPATRSCFEFTSPITAKLLSLSSAIKPLTSRSNILPTFETQDNFVACI